VPDDHYISEDIISAGPSAKVYRGHDRSTGMRVRLKALLCLRTTGYDLDHEAVRELATHLQALQHPQITRLLAVDEHDNDMTIVSELSIGVNAWQFMQHRPLMPADARAVASQLVMALQAGESLGLRHGDVKPSNVIMADHPAGGVVVQLQDWGLSECRHHQPRETMQFRALERLRGEPCSAQSDLFSLGATMAALLLGRAPADGGTPEELHHAWAEFDPMLLRHARPDLDPAFHDWLTWLLRADATLRPSSAAQAYDVLASSTGFLAQVQPVYAMPMWQAVTPTAPLISAAPATPEATANLGPTVPKPKPPKTQPLIRTKDAAASSSPKKKRSKRATVAILFNVVALLFVIGFVVWMGARWGSDWPTSLRKVVVENFLGGHVEEDSVPTTEAVALGPVAAPVSVAEEPAPQPASKPKPKSSSKPKTVPPKPELPLPTAGGLQVRYVRVEIPGKGTLNLAEVEVFVAGTNVAKKCKATAKDTDWGGKPEMANDGNTNGDWKRKSIYHSKESTDGPWWEVDLGNVQTVQSIKIWNRSDGGYASRLSNFSVIALDQDRKEVWRTDKQPVPKPSQRFDLPGAK
jgi:serine/threonine protein kinase